MPEWRALLPAVPRSGCYSGYLAVTPSRVFHYNGRYGGRTAEEVLNDGPNFFILKWKKYNAVCRFDKVDNKLLEVANQSTATKPKAPVWFKVAASEDDYWKAAASENDDSGAPEAFTYVFLCVALTFQQLAP